MINFDVNLLEDIHHNFDILFQFFFLGGGWRVGDSIMTAFSIHSPSIITTVLIQNKLKIFLKMIQHDQRIEDFYDNIIINDKDDTNGEGGLETI